MKRCPGCKQHKPLGEFGRNRSMKDGKQHCCFVCQRARNKKSRQANAERQRRYILGHPEIARAHSLARSNKAKLQKSKCECCGTTKRLHMHHPDYSKPLEVVTLCNPCHEYTHVLMAAMAESAKESNS